MPAADVAVERPALLRSMAITAVLGVLGDIWLTAEFTPRGTDGHRPTSSTGAGVDDGG